MKTTLIIGATSGIGKSLAQKLILRNEQVISISRNTPDIQCTQHHTHDILSETDLPQLEGVIDGIVYCPGSINLKPFRAIKLQDYKNDSLFQENEDGLDQSRSNLLSFVNEFETDTIDDYHKLTFSNLNLIAKKFKCVSNIRI